MEDACCLELSSVDDAKEVWEEPKLLRLPPPIFLQSFFTESDAGAMLEAVTEAPEFHEPIYELLPDVFKRFLNEEGLLASIERHQEANSAFRVAKTRLISGRLPGSESQHSVINCARAGGIVLTLGLSDPWMTFR
jgi:hypothetical protein